MRVTGPIPPGLAEAMLGEYQAGATYSEIAARHGRGYDQVRRTLVKLAPSRRPGPAEMDADTGLIVGLREEGMSWNEIARKVGMSYAGVRSRYSAARGTRRR